MVFEHLNELLDAPGAGCRLLSGLNSKQDREPIPTVQGTKEGVRLRTALQRCLQILGHGGGAGRFIGSFPASVLFGAVNLRETGRLHASIANQPLGLFSIDFRPNAAPATWCEFLEPARLVVAFALAINPTVAERLLHGFGVGYRACRRRFPGKLDP